MRWRTVAPLICIAIICLCMVALGGGGASGGDSSGSTTPSATSSPSVSKRPIAEVASIVAQQRARIEKLRNELDGCPSSGEIEAITCAVVVQRAPLEGGITVKAFNGLMGASMPDEVTVLFNQTYSAAVDLSIVDVTGCNDTTLNAECSSATFKARTATDDLLAKFDGWGPYQ